MKNISIFLLIFLSSFVLITNAYSSDITASSEKQSQSFETVMQLLSGKYYGDITTLQAKRLEDQLIKKSFSGNLIVFDVSETPETNIVIKATVGPYAGQELRFIITDASLKEKAAALKRKNFVRITLLIL